MIRDGSKIKFNNKSPVNLLFIGIKKLLGLVDLARQTEPQHRAIKFLTKMEEEGGLEMMRQQ
uniref:NSF AAA+ ATPase lid domain-containing protein n=1 Tax=Glossina palpalis gambiensis TaxID=67801 RepID=A0A1B0BYR5_9MUSC